MAEQPDPDSLSQHPTWNQGDFTLISSDNVIFKAPSRILLCVSEVLADAADTSSGDKCVHFGDREVETSEVIERFLELSCRGELSPKAKGTLPYCTDVARLLSFIYKYECNRLLPPFELWLLKYSASSTLAPMDVFALASAADAPFVCQFVLDTSHVSIIYDMDPHAGFGPNCYSLDALHKQNFVDPGAMSFAASRIVRPEHAWALQRAWALSFHILEDHWVDNAPLRLARDPEVLASYFRGLLAEMKSPQNAKA